MQQRKEATHNMKKTQFGGHPSTGPGFGSENALAPHDDAAEADADPGERSG
jgi:hypothetical protein